MTLNVFKFFGYGAVFLMSVLPASALDAPERAFIWNEANADMQNARTPSDYLQAASIYQHLVDDGVRNGLIFYNMGTALLLADRNDEACRSFERAERYLGRQADIEQNLQIASARKANSAQAQLPWYRVIAFWHFYFSCPQRSCIAVFSFLLFWLALILRRLGIERMMNAAALISLVVCVAFASSVAASWQAENTARRYNLTIAPVMAPTNPPSVAKPG
jgi:hypothetical protein